MSDVSLIKQKKTVRALMNARLQRITQEERENWSDKIAAHITNMDCYARAAAILGFIAMPFEVDISPILKKGMHDGKSIFVPRMNGREIRFHRIESLKGPWEKHPYGVLEPSAGLPVYDNYCRRMGEALVVTPGLAFDNSGGRLGFGKGYYDRFIRLCRTAVNDAGAASIRFIAVCFHLQLIEKVPAGKYDCVLDGLVSEKGVEYGDAAIGQL